MMTADQMRAARALLGWSQAQLSEKSGVSLPTIKRMETAGTGKSAGDTIQKVETTLAASGIQFIPENGGGAGVRWAKRQDAPE